MKEITISEMKTVAKEFGLAYSKVAAVKDIESGGKGFDSVTQKIIIQFEPVWFRKKSPYTPSGKWSLNGVERQLQEWIAFNDAFRLNPDAAMESTSIGMMQVMGFHYKRLGFKTVGEMWDFAKKSERNQVWLGLEFLRTDKVIYKAIIVSDWNTVALRYNGSDYARLGYHNKLRAAEKKFIKRK